MLKNRGIRDRLLLLAVMPPALIAILVGGYLIDTRVQDLARAHQDLGQTIANQLAPASEFGISTGDRAVLRHLANAALSDPNVRTVIIHDAAGRELARAEQREPAADEHSWLERILRITDDDYHRVFTAPIGLVERDIDNGYAGSLGQVEVHVSRTQAQARQVQVRINGMLIIAVALMISMLLALRVTRDISRPMRHLTIGVQALRQGQFSHRVREESGGELGVLERGINAMAAELQARRHELRSQVDQATAELRSTLEELEIKNVELDLARRRAVEASKSKSGFLANMSHEIRTPVNGILGFTRLLQETRLDGEQAEYTHIIHHSAASLLAIINDILDFSRVEANKLVIDEAGIDLPALVEDTVSLLAPQAYDKGLEIARIIYSDVPHYLLGDPVRLRQILTNLLGNAIKFTSEGHVVVRVMSEHEDDERVTLTISVSDTGIGISAADQNNIFKAFSQADSSTTRRYGGTGLGLFISDKLVQAMGGRMGFQSRPQEGSRFWFTLNLAKQAPARPEIETPLAGCQVLLYESFHLAALAMRHSLENWGASVTEADSPIALEQALQQQTPDRVVLGLPARELRQDGEGLALIRRIADTGHPCLVFVNATNRLLYQQIREAGARLCLPRVVRRDNLLQALREMREPSTPVTADSTSGTDQATPTSDRLHGLRLLVADDNRINLRLMTTLLRKNGAEVDEAEDGQAALGKLSTQHYDCVLLDVHMPVLSGTDAVRRLRESETDTERTPVLAVTANAIAEQWPRFQEAGMDDCLVKPVDEQCLVETVLRWTRDGTGSDETPTTPAAASNEPDPVTLAMLLEDLPAHRQQLLDALAKGDGDTALHFVHLINGSAAFCRIQDIRELAGRLENTLRGEGLQHPQVPTQATRLSHAIERFVARHLGSRATENHGATDAATGKPPSASTPKRRRRRSSS